MDFMTVTLRQVCQWADISPDMVQTILTALFAIYAAGCTLLGVWKTVKGTGVGVKRGWVWFRTPKPAKPLPPAPAPGEICCAILGTLDTQTAFWADYAQVGEAVRKTLIAGQNLRIVFGEGEGSAYLDKVLVKDCDRLHLLRPFERDLVADKVQEAVERVRSRDREKDEAEVLNTLLPAMTVGTCTVAEPRPIFTYVPPQGGTGAIPSKKTQLRHSE